MHLCVCACGGGGGGGGDAGGLFVSPTDMGKKLFRRCEVKVLIALNLLPDGSLWNRW